MRDVSTPTGEKHNDSLTWSESDRLAALRGYGILDTHAEASFDEIAGIAAHICETPISLVSFVDEVRQWFKAEIGLGRCETSREVSICAHAIKQPEQRLFVVPDTTKDPRFASNPLVLGEPHIRFYAGAVLSTPEGLPLGTLCVIDHQPRPGGLSDQQGLMLMALARQVITQLEHRRIVSRLAEHIDELKRSEEGRELLARELSHRIKNIFAVVGGLAASSARGHPEAAEFARDFRERVNALAQAHEYVRPQSPQSALTSETVQGLMRVLLTPYLQNGSERITIGGDDVPIGPASATALALVLHEQATNAVKYGALSTEAGQVRITAAREVEHFVLEWQELGGPPITGVPERKGFGTQMATRSVVGQLNGSLNYDWKPGGLTLRLSVEAANLLG
jgi:two-component sensor histidine kinase